LVAHRGEHAEQTRLPVGVQTGVSHQAAVAHGHGLRGAFLDHRVGRRGGRHPTRTHGPPFAFAFAAVVVHVRRLLCSGALRAVTVTAPRGPHCLSSSCSTSTHRTNQPVVSHIRRRPVVRRITVLQATRTAKRITNPPRTLHGKQHGHLARHVGLQRHEVLRVQPRELGVVLQQLTALVPRFGENAAVSSDMVWREREGESERWVGVAQLEVLPVPFARAHQTCALVSLRSSLHSQ